MRTRSIALSVALTALAATLLGACQSATAPTVPYTSVAEASLTAGERIPDPTGRPVLTFTGLISNPNDGATVSLDLATIERMGLVRYAEDDPWLEERLDFTGVLMTELLTRVGADENATTLRISAIDDYQVEIAIADVERWPVLLATQTNGQPMSIAEKGPTRIIFPHSTFPDIDRLKYKDLWIWQIDTIEVA